MFIFCICDFSHSFRISVCSL